MSEMIRFIRWNTGRIESRDVRVPDGQPIDPDVLAKLVWAEPKGKPQ